MYSSAVTIRIGYADELNRKLGNRKGQVWIRGSRVLKWCNTIPYEILTDTGHRVKRIFTTLIFRSKNIVKDVL